MFVLTDITASQVILYIDDSGNVGLGSAPNGGQSLTVQGTSVFSNSATLGNGVMQPGTQAGYEGTLVVPAYGSATVSVSAAQPPSVTSTVATSSVTSSAVVFSNGDNYDKSNNYSIW